MLRRARSASFLADAFVFPGGRLEASDGTEPPPSLLPLARAAVRELAEEASIHVAVAGLVPFAHWITPSAEPKRFDTCFFLAALHDRNQVAHADAQETVESLWGTPTALLAKHAHGEIKLAPPTLFSLTDLSAQRTVEAALEWARTTQIVAFLPKVTLIGDLVNVVLPWDAEYPRLEGEGEPCGRPNEARPSRYVYDDGKWRAG